MRRTVAGLALATAPLTMIAVPGQADAATTAELTVSPKTILLNSPSTTKVGLTATIPSGLTDSAPWLTAYPEPIGSAGVSLTLTQTSGTTWTAAYSLAATAKPGDYCFKLFWSKNSVISSTLSCALVYRRTRITFAALPHPIKAGHKLTLSGRLTYRNAAGTYVAIKNEAIFFYFRKKGTKTWKILKGLAATTKNGNYSKTYTATASGYWRAAFLPMSTPYQNITSTSVYVRVR